MSFGPSFRELEGYSGEVGVTPSERSLTIKYLHDYFWGGMSVKLNLIVGLALLLSLLMKNILLYAFIIFIASLFVNKYLLFCSKGRLIWKSVFCTVFMGGGLWFFVSLLRYLFSCL